MTKKYPIITIWLLAGMLAACGNDSATPVGTESCEPLPPPNELYGEPQMFTEPDEEPFETITYRWNCVPTEIVFPDGDAPDDVPFRFIEEEWERGEKGCWTLTGGPRRANPACGGTGENADETE